MAEPIGIQIILQLRRIVRAISIHSKHIHETYHITIPQLLCLQEVYAHGPITIGALTKVIHLNNSTVTGIIDRLEKRKLVQRRRISKDRRQIHVEITDEGIEFLNKAPAPLQECFVERLGNLEEDKVTMIVWALEILIDLLNPEKIESDIISASGCDHYMEDIKYDSG